RSTSPSPGSCAVLGWQQQASAIEVIEMERNRIVTVRLLGRSAQIAGLAARFALVRNQFHGRHECLPHLINPAGDSALRVVSKIKLAWVAGHLAKSIVDDHLASVVALGDFIAKSLELVFHTLDL